MDWDCKSDFYNHLHNYLHHKAKCESGGQYRFGHSDRHDIHAGQLAHYGTELRDKMSLVHGDRQLSSHDNSDCSRYRFNGKHFRVKDCDDGNIQRDAYFRYYTDHWCVDRY